MESENKSIAKLVVESYENGCPKSECPTCSRILWTPYISMAPRKVDYCCNCGQKLDWEGK